MPMLLPVSTDRPAVPVMCVCRRAQSGAVRVSAQVGPPGKDAGTSFADAFAAYCMTRLISLAFALALSLAAPLPTGLAGTTMAGGKTVADAVVWLDASGALRTGKPAEAVLEQRNLQFSPRVLAVEVGTRVRFPNDDRVLHNVFSYHDGKPFDLGLYPVGEMKYVPFDHPGLSRVFCNIHSQMAAYVMVVDSPYFAVSDASGRFVIAGVPDGSYRYHAWRPGGAVINDSVTVRNGAALEVRWP